MREPHSPCHARRSVWGSPESVELDGISSPDGPGWRLDRRRFEAGLRATAEASGALVLAPVRPVQVERERGAWRLLLSSGEEVRARLLIDAAGRDSRLLRPFGQHRTATDRLVCAWTHLPLKREPAEITYVESEPEGWWYTAPLPGGRRLLAFHTDADLAAARGLLGGGLLERAARLPSLMREMADADLVGAGAARLCAAHSARLTSPIGEGWLAVGDAALAFDPLSSQGLFNALYTGLQGGLAAARSLSGDASGPAAYAARLEEIWKVYERHLALYYTAEARWPEALFWTRRREGGGERRVV